jgi:chemotaxis signal transduction protein
VVVEVHQADPDVPPMVAGLLVDAVFEVLDRPGNAIEPAPELGNLIEPRYLAGITRADGQLLNVLALAALLGVEDLASAIEAHLTH